MTPPRPSPVGPLTVLARQRRPRPALFADIWRGLLVVYVLLLRLITGRRRADQARIAELEVELGYRSLESVIEDKTLFAALWRSGRLRLMMDTRLSAMRHERHRDHREIACADARDAVGLGTQHSFISPPLGPYSKQED